ncbi:MAG: hypothetical protein AAFZ15_20285 [Bacteroidota bacterium]
MKKLNTCLLFLSCQPKIGCENTAPPDWSTLPTLNQINRDMFVCLMLSKNRAPEVMKTNARYMDRVRDILAHESGLEKNTILMTAWDNWANSLEKILTGKQFNLFLSMNHNSLWQLQMKQF